jgi:hypothetical protein
MYTLNAFGDHFIVWCSDSPGYEHDLRRSFEVIFSEFQCFTINAIIVSDPAFQRPRSTFTGILVAVGSKNTKAQKYSSGERCSCVASSDNPPFHAESVIGRTLDFASSLLKVHIMAFLPDIRTESPASGSAFSSGSHRSKRRICSLNQIPSGSPPLGRVVRRES